MPDATPSHRSWRRRAFRTAAGLVVLAVALAVAVHLPPARRYALQRAVALVEERYQLRLRADGLDYNLFALSVALTGLRVSAAETIDVPFFEADRAAVRLTPPWRGAADRPEPLFESIEVNGGRVRIHRTADGRSNLPSGTGDDAEPAALRLGSVAADLSVEFVDGESGSRLWLPSVDLRLGTSNQIALREPGLFARGDASTTIRELEGGLAFDGRIVRVSDLSFRSDELNATIRGDLRLLVRNPAIDVRIAARGDIAQLLRWGAVDEPVQGAIDVEARVSGPLAAPVADARVRTPRLQWRRVVVTDMEMDAAIAADHLRVRQAGGQLAGGRVDASGDLAFRAGDSRATATWADLDVGAIASMLDIDGLPPVAGRASGRAGASGPSLDVAGWLVEAQTRIARGTVAGSVMLEGDLDLRLERGVWRLRAAPRVDGVAVRAELRGRLNLDVPGRSTLAGRITLPSTPLSPLIATVRRAGLELDALPAGLDDLSGAARADAAIAGTFSRPAVTFEGELSVLDVTPLAPGTPLEGTLDIRFQGDLDAVRLQATLPALNAQARATVATRAPFELTADLSTANVAVERLVRGIEIPAPVGGTITASARFSGRADRWQQGEAALDVIALDARVGTLPVTLSAPLRLEYDGAVLHVAALEVAAGGLRLSAVGGLPLESAPSPDAPALIVTVTGDLEQVTHAAAATGLVRLPDVSGTGAAALLARVTGSLERPRVAGDLELGPGTLRWADLPPVTGVHLRAHSDGEWVDLHELTAEWQRSRIEATGRMPLALVAAPAAAATPAPRAELHARVLGITPEVLAPFLEPEAVSQIAGSIDATLRAEASSLAVEDLSGELRLDRMDLRIADLPVAQRQPTRITVSDGFARVTAWEWAGQGGSVDIRGQVRLTDRQAALLANGLFDLRMLAPFVRGAGVSLAGSFEPRLSLTGALADPRLDGVAAIVDADVRLVDPRIVATGVNGRIVLSRTRAQLMTLSGTVNGGTLSGAGLLEYGPGRPADAALTLNVDGMAIELPEGLRSELNAALGLKVTVPPAGAPPAGTVSGTVTVLRSAYREPIAVATNLLARLRTQRLALGTAPAGPSLLDRLALDVRVVTEDDVIVDNNIGRLQLGADVRVLGTAAAPALGGRATLREGGQLFLGRNIYTLESGTIDFVNPVTVEPELAIVAHTRAGGEDISLTLKGAADRPDVELRSTSTPELGQADLASLLLTGRRLDEIGGAEAEIVGEQALAYLSGDVLGFAGRAVGLDTIRLGGVDETTIMRDPSAVATELDPTSRLTFGKSIGRNVDVTLSQSLRDSDAQTWIVDYRPRRRVEARFVSNDENLRAYQLRHDVSFGGASLSGPAPPRTRVREPRVDRVEIAGASALPESRVRGVLRLGPGDRFDFAEWQRDRDRVEEVLHREGYYEARVSTRRDGDDPVALEYLIVEGPRTTIDATGYDLARDTTAALQRAWSTAAFDEFFAEEAAAIVRTALARDGHLQAGVATSFRRTEGAKTLVLRIEPGPRAASRRILFEGVGPPLAAALDDWAAPGAAALAIEDPRAFEEIATLWLRARGHLRARVTVGAPAIGAGEAIVPVRVAAGPPFEIRTIRVDGAGRLEAKVVRDALGLASGTPFDPAAAQSASDRLVALYRREGFPAVQAVIVPGIDDAAGAVDLVVEVTEGPRQVIGAVNVQGNRAIDTDVITRNLALTAGEPAGADTWLQARRRLFATGLFRRVDVTPEAVSPPQPDATLLPMRARVTVQEWPALRLRYGFVVAEERPEDNVEGRELVPGVSADLTRRTLFGRALTVGAAFEYQRRERRGRGFVTAPTMFGWPIESSLLLERSREEFAAVTLVTDRTGASWEQRFRHGRHLRLSYAFRFERNRTFDTAPADPTAPIFDVAINVGRLNVAAAFDSRDDAANPSAGMLLSSSLDYAPARLGSSIRFTRYLGQAYFFRPWKGVVLASALRAGFAFALDGQDLVPSERFFAGGARSMRGVAEDGLGPRDFLGDPAGGESLLILNGEARFPIFRWVRGVAFLDAGNVFERASGIDFGGLRAAFGAGLRLATPFAMLRADYGRLFSPGPNDRSGRWMFGIGHAF